MRLRALIGTFIVAAAVAGCGRRITDPAVRAALAAESLGAFDLVLTLHGLDGAHKTDWRRAEQLCRGLQWPRCDRQALEEMQRRSRLSSVVRKDPVAAAALATADLIWAFGSEDAARQMFRAELDRLPESDGPARARVFVRFGIIDSNYDGQAALFAQACVADPNVCELRAAASRRPSARCGRASCRPAMWSRSTSGDTRRCRAALKPVARDPGGRVHLTVHRDPASGAESVALAAPVFEEDWQNDVAAAAANTVHGPSRARRALEGAVALARDSMDGHRRA